MDPKSLQSSPILQGIEDLNAWRSAVVEQLHGLSNLTSELGLLPGSVILHLETLAFEIERDSLRLALVGEFSRGKTELINALFFADQGTRLLPSGTGQTTMCPVEIRGAPQGRPGLQLLPIASRAMDVSIEKLKRAGSAWVRLAYDSTQQAHERSAMLKSLTETTCVTIEEARRLGLCPPLNRTPKDRERSICPSCGLGKVLIPRWRHAQLFLPHPILDAGLTILDTPGLNAIGAEPELTFGMLADADAVLFVLGIDTGVTQSDLTIWDQYLRRNKEQPQLVLLNKIDTLWDELRDPFEIEDEISMQVEKTAQRLGIDAERVLPVSGQKALLARIRGDAHLLEKSGLPQLEASIARLLIPARRAVLQERCTALVERVQRDQQQLLQEQDRAIAVQMESIQALKERTSEKVPRLVAQHKAMLASFDQDRQRFEARKADFRAAVDRALLAPLSPDRFDARIGAARSEMLAAWTTAGIVERFRSFFAEAIAHFDTALRGSAEVNAQIAGEYAALQERYRLPSLSTIPYAIMPRRAELLAMAENYERFGMMLEIAVNTQSAVVRKAFLTVAGKVRDFIVETRRDAEGWVDEMMAVMNRQLELYRQKAEEELDALENIAVAMGNIDTRLQQLRANRAALAERSAALEQIANRLHRALQGKSLD
ncbi:MAG: dynamin family protein [Acidithiobacillus caldus]|uniref:GTP-binding protein n=1 Tax=Acidithiobacillus caldus TaxID=33059 RepID=A0A1E7YXM1_9PROT|nr:dynamin family protein [Acidithiobacillus caldus]MBU2790319.1 GTP-binding protein [Acidithiobacillus caldus]MBU2820611.1 GTP-binding protein [Acidithiobacillus caldus]OFC61253.1 GTP-binding protein [Acidithiobacillus caldus]WMT46548.1 MAG: dynamin family protein [Acidithiobacillus caldus]